MGRCGETFPSSHTDNGNKDSKWQLLFAVFVLSELGEYTHPTIGSSGFSVLYFVLINHFLRRKLYQ
jgi:hypothetical protein